MNPFIEINRARKRAVSMGQHSNWEPSYNQHPLAACIENYSTLIEIELVECHNSDWFFILFCIHEQAKEINKYCDKNKVVGDAAAQHWLDRFEKHCNVVCDVDIAARINVEDL
jgi:hypothetical protein